ncbi:MAG: aspartate--tRNA ligase [Acholeplasmataceae bacterium]
MKRTHYNHELTKTDIGKKVVLNGWVAKTRRLGGIIFIDLRDRFGITQLLIKPDHPHYKLASQVRSEYVIEIEGIVNLRENKNINIPTGEIEVEIAVLNVLNQAETPPILVQEETDALEETRLKYRYLDLRRQKMQNYLIKRHEITQAIRHSLVEAGYYEIETPLLGKSTPEGARDYLVPSRLYHGQFYALPQSPQMFKQLFMIAGFEKYFQIAKCFRDEDLRADRQPEFTQVDIEASFITNEDLYDLIEKMFVYLYKKVLGKTIKTPFLRMPYDEAMSKYGSDKPDLRFELLLEDFTHIFKNTELPFLQKKEIKGIRVKKAPDYSRKQLDTYKYIVQQNHGETLATIKKTSDGYSGSLAKNLSETELTMLELNDEEMIFLVPGKLYDINQSLGALRLQLGTDLKLIEENENSFLWVVDWPLLEYDEDEKRYYAKHHPFTAPVNAEDLKNAPKDAKANAYDLVLNGNEIGGGSMRIYHQKTQQLMFKTLGLSDEDIKSRFGFFVDALKYGTPPHGGIALGLDRIVMMMTNTNNIKDVIAFPKTQSAKDLMMEAPSDVDLEQLDELGLKL